MHLFGKIYTKIFFSVESASLFFFFFDSDLLASRQRTLALQQLRKKLFQKFLPTDWCLGNYCIPPLTYSMSLVSFYTL